MTQQKTLTIIPAKGASVRLPRKNMLKLGGRTLVEHAYYAAKESNICGDILVSTEDEEIAQHAKEIGAWVPFKRPDKLAVNPAGVEQVALYTLDVLEETGYSYDLLIILLPTCPLRTSEDIINAKALYDSEGAERLFSVTEFEHSPYGAWKLSESNLASPLFENESRLKSQDRETLYRCNGAIHILNVNAFRTIQCYTSLPLAAYIMPAKRSVDVDCLDDFKLCQWMINDKSS